MFILLTNVKMPTIVKNANNCWLFNIYEQNKLHSQRVKHEKNITSGQRRAYALSSHSLCFACTYKEHTSNGQTVAKLTGLGTLCFSAAFISNSIGEKR